MSRIAGVIHPKASLRLAAMFDPLGRGAFFTAACRWQADLKRCALGWLGEAQPNVSDQGRIAAVMDGCVYNKEELGQESADAELLVKLYGLHGFEGALSRMNGDFAVALFDEATQTLWLGRDRFGVKPLYYVQRKGLTAFASRPGPLLELPGMPRKPRREFVALFAVSHYRTFDNDPAKSPYEEIHQLPAGHCVCLKDGSAKVSRYWGLEALPEWEEDEETLAGRYQDLLLDAVALRISCAPERAFTLSGGMDSSSVLACAKRQSGSRQRTLSAVYEDKTFDESAEIKDMLDAASSEWLPVKIGVPAVLDVIGRMITTHDEPVATATWLSHFLLCGLARRSGINVLFGGLGGDELNAGEYEYFFQFFADLKSAERNALLNTEVQAWIEHHDHPVFKKSVAVMEDGLKRFVDISRPGVCLPDRPRLERYASALAPGYYDLGSFEPVMDRIFPSYLSNRAYQDLFRETLPCCLRAQDRNGAALGISHVVPFLDHRLVEFMFRVPGTMKIRGGVTKHLLRRAMKGILPEATRARVKKTGWNAPAHRWFAGRGREGLMDLVRSREFRERGIYDPAEVERLSKEHEDIVLSGKQADNHMMFLWQVANLELWLRWLASLDS